MTANRNLKDECSYPRCSNRPEFCCTVRLLLSAGEDILNLKYCKQHYTIMVDALVNDEEYKMLEHGRL